MAGKAPRPEVGLAARGHRFAIVASRFHEDIGQCLVEGAREALRRHGAADKDVLVVWVPGAFELPQAALALARRRLVDAVVCVGCVIRGETPHFDYVAGEAARGIAEVGRLTGLPVTFGVITASTQEQAVARAGGRVGNRGEEAALAALELVRLFHALDGRAPGRRPTRRPAGRPKGQGRPDDTGRGGPGRAGTAHGT
jgi:6,7-dimethyl-8-ribityllumazine synthase